VAVRSTQTVIEVATLPTTAKIRAYAMVIELMLGPDGCPDLYPSPSLTGAIGSGATTEGTESSSPASTSTAVPSESTGT
jgi:hypothetical protein